MTALVNLLVGLALAALYVSYHPSKESGDIGREYIAVNQALADPKLPADERTLLELRRTTMANAIRADYAERIGFDVKTVPLTEADNKSGGRALLISSLTVGQFADFDWSVSHATDVRAVPDQGNSTQGVLHFRKATGDEAFVITATLKSDKRISKTSLVGPLD